MVAAVVVLVAALRLRARPSLAVAEPRRQLVGPEPQPDRRLAVAVAAQPVRLVHRRASTLQVRGARLA